MLPRETTGGKETKECSDCEVEMKLGVYKSAAGHWIGYWCSHCGPYGRETDYFGTEQEAKDALDSFHSNGILPKART